MEPIDKSKNNKVHRYCCSNPNCKKVFSKPKIIKYYVCPSCQTLVDMTFENFQSPAQKKPVLEKKQVTLRKQKESKQDKNQEPKAITSQQATTNNELTSMEKPEVKEILETTEPARGRPQMEEPNIVEITVNKKSGLMGSDLTCLSAWRLAMSNEKQLKNKRLSPRTFNVHTILGTSVKETKKK